MMGVAMEAVAIAAAIRQGAAAAATLGETEIYGGRSMTDGTCPQAAAAVATGEGTTIVTRKTITDRCRGRMDLQGVAAAAADGVTSSSRIPGRCTVLL